MPANALRLNNVAMLASASQAAFVGPLDALVAQGATLLYAGSVRRLLSSWTGNAMRLQGNGSGNPIAAIPFLANGDLDLTAAAAAASASGGTVAYGETWYDQSGRLDATQTTIANQMRFSTAVESKGSFGDASSSSGVFFSIDLGTIPVPSFFVFVVNCASSPDQRLLLGLAGSAFNRYCRLNNNAMGQNWGSLLTGTAGEVTAGKHVLGFLCNGSSSSNVLDGSSILTGNAGNTQLNLSTARIGSANSSTTNWTSSASNTLSEVIIFNSNPTGLAGWPAFVAAQKTYFGVP